jgi:hypothetical protein
MMGKWGLMIGGLVVVAVGFAALRQLRSIGAARLDLGEVSESWLREQRGDKRHGMD